MKKILVSSISLRVAVRNALMQSQDVFEWVCHNRQLVIEGDKNILLIECSEDFDILIYRDSMSMLLKVLNVIDEQPLTIGLEDCSKTFGIKILEMYV